MDKKHSPMPMKQSMLIMHRLRLSVIIGGSAWLLGANATFAEVAQDKARAIAANHGRRCYVDMADGQVKCRLQALRSLASAQEFLSAGKLVSDGKIRGCNVNKAVWAFEWRAFPEQPPILVDAKTGKLVNCRP